ncbi:MAG: HD domain-containing phosphohydrolase [Planctomycetota bacterium]|jgi:HD-GYP domain-containing protein (c-di-GMP phosphodiesterase class II)
MEHEPNTSTTAQTGCFSFDITSAPDDLEPFDIYLLHEHTTRPTLYAARGLGLSEQERQRLSAQGVHRLYTPLEQHPAYRRILLDRLELDYLDQDLSPEARHHATYEHIREMVAEALRPSEHLESFITITELAERMTRWACDDLARFSSLLDLSDYTFTLDRHLYNTAIGAGCIARLEQPDNIPLIRDAIIAGFLHDIALASVPDEIVSKLGTLSPEEWHDINAHPLRAYNTLKDCPNVPETVLHAIYNHHERMDGGGYPRGLRASDIDTLTNILIVADTFDTIRASRTHRAGLHPIDAIETMFDGVGAHFAQRSTMIWQQIVSESIQQHPARIDQQRAPRDTHQSHTGHITRILQAGPKGMRPYALSDRISSNAHLTQDERRGAPRVNYETSLRASVLHHGKASNAAVGQELMLLSVEVSLTGIQVITPWAFSKGDILMLHLPKPGGKVIPQQARVVRVRKREDSNWIAGLEFLTHAQVPKGTSAA